MKIKVTRNLESYKKNRQVESCKKESVGQDVAEYQKWVDYDMKRYGRISNDTLKKVRAAGLSVVKDQYGDYEVIAYRKDESCKDESCKGKKITEAPIYDLSPVYDSRQSFYSKARVDTGDKDDQNKLYSYNTLVAEIKDGKPVVYGTYSATTLRHIKDWLKQNGFKADTSKQIMADYGVKDESYKKDEAKEPARKLRIRELPKAKKEIRKSFGDDISPDEI